MGIVFSSRQQFSQLFRWSILFYSVPLSLLFMFYPPWIVGCNTLGVLLVYAWLVATSGKAFDHLTDNYRHRGVVLAIVTLLLGLGYVGACYKVAQGSQSVFLFLFLIGLLSLSFTAYAGFSAGVRIHERHLKRRMRSMDWETATYDVSTHSLAEVDIESAIFRSSPTWKIFVFLAVVFSPGPALGILAGKISTHAQYMVAVPAFWGSTMVFGYMVLRLAIDYVSLVKMEKERGVRLLLSTSTLLENRRI